MCVCHTDQLKHYRDLFFILFYSIAIFPPLSVSRAAELRPSSRLGRVEPHCNIQSVWVLLIIDLKSFILKQSFALNVISSWETFHRYYYAQFGHCRNTTLLKISHLTKEKKLSTEITGKAKRNKTEVNKWNIKRKYSYLLLPLSVSTWTN